MAVGRVQCASIWIFPILEFIRHGLVGNFYNNVVRDQTQYMGLLKAETFEYIVYYILCICLKT